MSRLSASCTSTSAPFEKRTMFWNPRRVAADHRGAPAILDAVAVSRLDRIVIDEEGRDLEPVFVSRR